MGEAPHSFLGYSATRASAFTAVCLTSILVMVVLGDREDNLTIDPIHRQPIKKMMLSSFAIL